MRSHQSYRCYAKIGSLVKSYRGRRNWFPINPADYRPHAGSITASIKLTFDDNPRRQNEKFDPSLPLHLFMEASIRR